MLTGAWASCPTLPCPPQVLIHSRCQEIAWSPSCSVHPAAASALSSSCSPLPFAPLPGKTLPLARLWGGALGALWPPLGRCRQPASRRRAVGRQAGLPGRAGTPGLAAVCVRCDKSGRLLGSNRLNSVFTVFQMAAVTMGFGDPLSPLQSVNRNAHFFWGSCP